MINNKTVLAVIPARGGSKRCPRKNIKPFRGKPLIQWTIEAAEKSQYLDYMCVSTEDDGIILALLHMSAAIIKRPDELATDDATNEDVLRHALSIHPADIVVLLQPTSPLRTAEDIDKVIGTTGTNWPCITYNKHGKKNGAVYCCSAEWLNNGGDFSMYYATPYFMPNERSLDIDDPEQFDD